MWSKAGQSVSALASAVGGSFLWSQLRAPPIPDYSVFLSEQGLAIYDVSIAVRRDPGPSSLLVVTASAMKARWQPLAAMVASDVPGSESSRVAPGSPRVWEFRLDLSRIPEGK